MSYRKYRLPRPPLDGRLSDLSTAVFDEIERRNVRRTLRRHIVTLQLCSVVSAFAVGVFYSETSVLNSMLSR